VTIAQALREAAANLAHASITPRLDAELLMAHALKVSRSDLLLRHMDRVVPEGFAELIARRAAHEPIAYLLGEESFHGLTFKVGHGVLIPRPDSEVLVEAALASRPDARTVLDCGTGSGALLLAVLSQLPDAQGVGVDRSPEALAVARHNAQALGLESRTRIERADWDQPGWADKLGGPFDLILANPPYVETQAALEASVREYEPAGALFAGEDGLDAYRVLIPQIPGLFAPGGQAFFEIGATQADAVRMLADDAGLAMTLHRDLAERPRVAQLSLEN